MSHYYVNDNNLKSDKHLVTYTYKGNVLKYNADNGVFSKDRVDFGTNVLLNALPDIEGSSRVLDVGCGYGIIGIAIAKSNPNIDVGDNYTNAAFHMELELIKQYPNDLFTDKILKEHDVNGRIMGARRMYDSTKAFIDSQE